MEQRGKWTLAVISVLFRCALFMLIVAKITKAFAVSSFVLFLPYFIPVFCICCLCSCFVCFSDETTMNKARERREAEAKAAAANGQQHEDV